MEQEQQERPERQGQPEEQQAQQPEQQAQRPERQKPEPVLTVQVRMRPEKPGSSR